MDERMKEVLIRILEWVRHNGRSNDNLVTDMENAIERATVEDFSARVFQEEDTLEITINKEPLTKITIVRMSPQKVVISACIGDTMGDPNWVGYSNVVLDVPGFIEQFYHQLRYFYAVLRLPEFRNSSQTYESRRDQETEATKLGRLNT